MASMTTPEMAAMRMATPAMRATPMASRPSMNRPLAHQVPAMAGKNLEGADFDRGQEAFGWGAAVDPGLGRWGGVVQPEGLVQECPQEHKPHGHAQDGQGLGCGGGHHGPADLEHVWVRWSG